MDYALRDRLLKEVDHSASKSGLVHLIITLELEGTDRGRAFASLNKIVPVEDKYPWAKSPSLGVDCTLCQAKLLIRRYCSARKMKYLSEIIVEDPAHPMVFYATSNYGLNSVN